ncbi:hypothetical protein AOQ84DRAFT_211171 [Glonium stellatum]|uniref:Uncharacterized protein n=1 Tax=Glonium stellatum TaxID=574774 RepID=A0A8E2F5F9_9PEZI|nr:hypothetical protein AOQ84DRAFT_211171 [Glonium stellatum]
MPGGFAGFPRDVTSGQPIGIASSFISKPKDWKLKNSKRAASQKTKDLKPPRSSFESVSTIEQQKSKAAMSSSKSPIMSAIDKMKDKLSGSNNKDTLPSSEAEFARLREKERGKERRKQEYERLGLAGKTKFGQGGIQMGS